MLQLATYGLTGAGAQHACAQGGPMLADFPEGVHITIAAPEGGELDAWTRVLIPALGSFMARNGPVRRGFAGGVDGVTGANQFTAQALPDGAYALLAPGAAVTNWLRGDARVRYDVASWVPVLSGFHSSVIAGRISIGQLARGQKLRIGISGFDGTDMAAVLGLAQLGLQPVAVPGLAETPSMLSAFAQHAVDLMVLRGPDIAPVLAGGEVRPLCVLGQPNSQGSLTRDPAMPGLPALGELLGGLRADARTAAWRVLAAAAQLGFALVLPNLSAASMVALWRQVAEQAAATPDLLALAGARATRLHNAPEAFHAAIGTAPTNVVLRDWLTEYGKL